MLGDQEKLIADLRRNGQGFTADRVEALSDVGFANFKRDLLRRFAPEGIFAGPPRPNLGHSISTGTRKD